MTDKTKKILLIVWAFAFICLILLVFETQKEQPDGTLQIEFENSGDWHIVSTSTRVLNSNIVLAFEKFGFQLVQETGWDLVTNDDVKLPAEMVGTQFALKKQGTDCVLAYLLTPYPNNYQQTSFANRIFTEDDDQIDGSWYLNKSNWPKDLVFQNRNRIPLPNEVLIRWYGIFPYHGLSQIFVLFDEKGGPVQNKCIAESEAMLTSLRKKVDAEKINYESKGAIFLSSNYNRKKEFFFVADNQTEVKMLPTLTVDNGFNPFVKNTLLYFKQGAIMKKFDVFSGRIEILPNLDFPKGDEIGSIYIAGNEMIFFVGPDYCYDYLARCELDLYSYNLKTNQLKLLAKKVPSRSISGYDPSGNKVYTHWSEGDAGCFWIKTNIVDINLGTTTESMRISSCDGDPDYKEKNRIISDYFKNFAGNSTTTDYLIIDSGKISLPAQQRFDLPQGNYKFTFIL